ncbi:MAG TPA: NAD(P)H-dependent oxidoreductase [Terriglobales bacterium]|nr:NAD(P)H-dependent oxidoreductase [Terriglobales bacterium]
MSSPSPVDQLVVLTHPDLNSFCASIASRWQQRALKHHQTCNLRDLYRDGFDPVLRATEQPGKGGFNPLDENLAECRRLEQLDVLVFVYPIWFGSPPAMLKGYLERVVGSGVAFGSSEQQAKPLANVRLVQIATSASSKPWLSEKGLPSALHTIYDQYIAEVFGAKHVDRLHLDLISAEMAPLHAAEQLGKVDELADRVCAQANADRWDRARKR